MKSHQREIGFEFCFNLSLEKSKMTKNFLRFLLENKRKKLIKLTKVLMTKY